MKIYLKKLHPNCTTPQYMTPGAAAMDVCACIDEPVKISAGQREIIPTGFAMGLPKGYAALLCARSGLASKQGICLSNGVGVIDSDYTGQVMVALHNASNTDFEVTPGQRIAQMLIIPVMKGEFEVVDELEATQRGEGGFGSTGTEGPEDMQ